MNHDNTSWIGCGGDLDEANYRMGLADSCRSWSAVDILAESEGQAEHAMWCSFALRADGSGKSCHTLFGRVLPVA